MTAFHTFFASQLFTAALWAASPGVISLDETAEINLGIQTVEVRESTFEETAFALGRIEEIPSHHAVLSSRIAGRIVEITAFEGDHVQAGQLLARVESRQPGDPPPIIELRAPIDGLVLESHVRLGEPVEPDKELLDISNLSEVWAVARVPEDQAGSLAPGAEARIRVAALGTQTLEGELLRFGTSADTESGTIDAVFRVPNPDLRLRPGMRAEFSIILSRRDNILLVPREAIQGDPARRVAFVRHPELPHAFVTAPVELGARNDRFIEIVRGLSPGDAVVTQGAYALSFAGEEGVSLKEALDAAHGHAHNEDGSEMNDDAGEHPATHEEDAEHAHEDDEDHEDHAHHDEHAHEDFDASHSALLWFLAMACGILLVLLVLSVFMRKPGAPAPL